MKEIIGEKLQELRKSLGMTKKAFAEYLDIKYTTYVGYENGGREPDSNFLVLLYKKLNVSSDWILGLQEEREVEHSYPLKEAEFNHIKKYRALDDFGRESVDWILERESQRKEMIEEAQKKEIPIRYIAYIGKIAAAGVFVDSFPILSEKVIGVPDTPQSRMADFAVGVSGESMEPDYCDGDIVLVKKTTDVNFGEVGIFQKENALWLKVYTPEGLHSINPKYEDMMDEQEVVRVGKVIGKVERIK